MFEGARAAGRGMLSRPAFWLSLRLRNRLLHALNGNTVLNDNMVLSYATPEEAAAKVQALAEENERVSEEIDMGDMP